MLRGNLGSLASNHCTHVVQNPQSPSNTSSGALEVFDNAAEITSRCYFANNANLVIETR